jgi:hypothetical protein
LLLVSSACGDDGGTTPQNDARVTDSSGGGGDGGGSDGGGGLQLTCASYCGAILAACTTPALRQYASMGTCMASCENFTPGTLGQTSGNTLGCRVYHTEAAMGDAAGHCEHAGPGGGGMCGASICEGFCSIAPNECPTQWQAGTCMTNCGLVPNTPPYNTSAAGDSIQCRLYHVTEASTAPGTHCIHTLGMGGACP